MGAAGLAVAQGEVLILEGDPSLVSGAPGAWGLRFDATKNDLAAVTERLALLGVDVPAVLVLFTTFEDRGAAGPAYYVPFENRTDGIGLTTFDQRADFGVEAFWGLANLKRPDSHRDLVPLLAHELAHRHLAYLTVNSTITPLLGRQNAHWHALLDSDASVLGGYDFVELSPGEFVVSRAHVGFSDLDLYGLGLLPAAEVRATFFVADGRTTENVPIPAEALLTPGTRILGRSLPIRVEEVIETWGPRAPASPRSHAVFVLLTAPGESATSSTAQAAWVQVDAARLAIEAAWPQLTRNRGTLCTRFDFCTESETVAEGCGCTTTGPAKAGRWGCLGLLLSRLLRRRQRAQRRLAQ